MENVIIWSTSSTKDHLYDASKQDKIAKLIDIGYDPEMLVDADLDEIIASEDAFYDEGIVELEEYIVPEIEQQTNAGIVLLVDSEGYGKAIPAPEMMNIAPNAAKLELVEIDGILTLNAITDDVITSYSIYALPEEEASLKEFVEVCLSEKVHEVQDFEDIGFEGAVEVVMGELDIDELNANCNFANVPDVCKPISLAHIRMHEGLTEAKAKDPVSLAAEYAEIKELSDEYGMEYFTSMPFSAFEDDPITIEVQYPNFAKVVKTYFKEMVPDVNYKDPEEMDFQWDSGLDQRDWNTLMQVCQNLVTKNKHGEYPTVQIEKIYKNNFDDGLE